LGNTRRCCAACVRWGSRYADGAPSINDAEARLRCGSLRMILPVRAPTMEAWLRKYAEAQSKG
jgi:hypothetical protein